MVGLRYLRSGRECEEFAALMGSLRILRKSQLPHAWRTCAPVISVFCAAIAFKQCYIGTSAGLFFLTPQTSFTEVSSTYILQPAQGERVTTNSVHDSTCKAAHLGTLNYRKATFFQTPARINASKNRCLPKHRLCSVSTLRNKPL